MKKFYLTKCIPYQGNREINKVFCNTLIEAISYFNQHGFLFHEAVSLDANGYEKKDEITYVVSEPFEIGV
jgi:hypothetical protein